MCCTAALLSTANRQQSGVCTLHCTWAGVDAINISTCWISLLAYLQCRVPGAGAGGGKERSGRENLRKWLPDNPHISSAGYLHISSVSSAPRSLCHSSQWISYNRCSGCYNCYITYYISIQHSRYLDDMNTSADTNDKLSAFSIKTSTNAVKRKH